MIVQRVKFYTLAIFLLLFFTSNSSADESAPSSDETVLQKDKQQVPEKVPDSKTDELESQSNREKGKEIKTDTCVQVEGEESKAQSVDSDANKNLKPPESKLPLEKVDEASAQTDTHNDKTDNVAIKKDENHEQSPENTDTKKQNTKDEHKTDLNDVNFLRDGEDHAGPRNEKREAFRESMTDYLGLPRDASYFFDDLEPFINNNSDNRVGRSAPNKETKGLKSKLSKGRDSIEVDDVDDDDEELRDEEEEDKQNEDDYDDDDEDLDSDCKPTPRCTTTPQCTTKPQCTTPTTCPPPTTKCTTRFQCPTKCPTPPPCPTKCPPKCAKPKGRQNKTCDDDDSNAGLGAGNKKLKKLKRRNHEKLNK